MSAARRRWPGLPVRPRGQRVTVEQARQMWRRAPITAAQGLPIGTDPQTGSPVSGDPVTWARSGLLPRNRVVTIGQVDSLLQRWVLGSTALGVRPVVLDGASRLTDSVAALGGQVLEIGRGADTLNVLEHPAHRLVVTSSLLLAATGVMPTVREQRLLATAIDTMTTEWAQPQAPVLWDVIAALQKLPDAQSTVQTLQSIVHHYGDVIARPTTVRADPDAPALSLSITGANPKDGFLRSALQVALWSAAADFTQAHDSLTMISPSEVMQAMPGMLDELQAMLAGSVAVVMGVPSTSEAMETGCAVQVRTDSGEFEVLMPGRTHFRTRLNQTSTEADIAAGLVSAPQPSLWPSDEQGESDGGRPEALEESTLAQGEPFDGLDLSWLAETSATDASVAADDRFAAQSDLAQAPEGADVGPGSKDGHDPRFPEDQPQLPDARDRETIELPSDYFVQGPPAEIPRTSQEETIAAGDVSARATAEQPDKGPDGEAASEALAHGVAPAPVTVQTGLPAHAAVPTADTDEDDPGADPLETWPSSDTQRSGLLAEHQSLAATDQSLEPVRPYMVVQSDAGGDAEGPSPESSADLPKAAATAQTDQQATTDEAPEPLTASTLSRPDEAPEPLTASTLSRPDEEPDTDLAQAWAAPAARGTSEPFGVLEPPVIPEGEAAIAFGDPAPDGPTAQSSDQPDDSKSIDDQPTTPRDGDLHESGADHTDVLLDGGTDPSESAPAETSVVEQVPGFQAAHHPSKSPADIDLDLHAQSGDSSSARQGIQAESAQPNSEVWLIQEQLWLLPPPDGGPGDAVRISENGKQSTGMPNPSDETLPTGKTTQAGLKALSVDASDSFDGASQISLPGRQPQAVDEHTLDEPGMSDPTDEGEASSVGEPRAPAQETASQDPGPVTQVPAPTKSAVVEPRQSEAEPDLLEVDEDARPDPEATQTVDAIERESQQWDAEMPPEGPAPIEARTTPESHDHASEQTPRERPEEPAQIETHPAQDNDDRGPDETHDVIPEESAPIEATATPSHDDWSEQTPVEIPEEPAPIEATATPSHDDWSEQTPAEIPEEPAPIEATATPSHDDSSEQTPAEIPEEPAPSEATATPSHDDWSEQTPAELPESQGAVKTGVGAEGPVEAESARAKDSCEPASDWPDPTLAGIVSAGSEHKTQPSDDYAAPATDSDGAQADLTRSPAMNRGAATGARDPQPTHDSRDPSTEPETSLGRPAILLGAAAAAVVAFAAVWAQTKTVTPTLADLSASSGGQAVAAAAAPALPGGSLAPGANLPTGSGALLAAERRAPATRPGGGVFASGTVPPPSAGAVIVAASTAARPLPAFGIARVAWSGAALWQLAQRPVVVTQLPIAVPGTTVTVPQPPQPAIPQVAPPQSGQGASTGTGPANAGSEGGAPPAPGAPPPNQPFNPQNPDSQS